MKFEIKNRFTGQLQFAAEIDCDKNASTSKKLGLAVKWGLKNNSNLGWADLGWADLEGADLGWADLGWAELEGANLRGANLEGANLEGVDLRGANLEIPVIKDIHQKVYEAASKEGALNMGEWHTCATTHCRAGWVTFLAGKDGEKLEKATSTATAAYLIYRKSSDLPCALNFYASNKDSLDEMKRMADLEAAQ